MSKLDLAPLAAMTIAMCALSLMDAFIKLASEDLQTWQIVVMRYGSGLLYAVAFFLILLRGKSVANDMRRLTSPQLLKTSMLRSVFVVLTAGCFFFALGNLPLAQAVAIIFTGPLFIVLFSRLILKEAIPSSALLAIALGFSGVLVIFGDAIFQPLGGAFVPMMSALLASVFYALAIVLSRKHSAHSKPQEMVMLQTTFALLLALPLGFLSTPETTWVVPSENIWMLFGIIGLLGTSGHLLIVWALTRETASRLSPTEYTTLIWVALFGFIIFGEVPDASTIVGALLVVVGCIVVGRSKTAVAP